MKPYKWLVMTSNKPAAGMYECISAGRQYAMGLAMVAVMLFHLKVPGFEVCGHWGVDVFMFASGFGIYHALSKSTSISCFYKRRLVRIMPAAVIAGVAVALVNYFFNNIASLDYELPYGFDYLLSASGLQLWFIRGILLLYLLSPLLYKLVGREFNVRKLILVTLLSQFTLFCFHYSVRYIPEVVAPYYYATFCWTNLRFVAFFCGMLSAAYGSRYSISWIRYGLLAFLLFVVAVVIRVLVDYGETPVFKYKFIIGVCKSLQYILIIPFIMIICGGLGYLVSRTSRVGLSGVFSVLRWFGLYSLEIYVVHESTFKVIENLCEEHQTMYIYYVISIPVSLILAFLLNRLCRVVVHGLRLSRVRIQC